MIGVSFVYAAVAFASAAALGGDLANNFEINIVSW